MFKEILTSSFEALAKEIQSHPRLCGYYLIRLIDLTSPDVTFDSPEQRLDAIFQDLDDQAWRPAEERPTDQLWSDYAVGAEAAKSHAIASLIGGQEIGHTRPTISRDLAVEFWCRFDAEFDQPKRYYTAHGLGDSEYVFQHGVVIVSETRAGVLGVIEND